MKSPPISVSVLIIENHPLMRKALRAAIDEEADLSVAGEVAQVEEALPIVSALAPDVILVALDNPGPEAVASLEALRQTLPAARILALAGGEVTGQEKDALGASAHAVLAKTTSRAGLVQAIRKIAAIRRIADG